MKKSLLVTALSISAVCCVVAAYFCQFYYTRYRNTVTELEYRINAFDTRLTTLEAHKSRELTPVHVWGVISTADRQEDEQLHFYLSSEKHPEGYFEAINAKGGTAYPTGAPPACRSDQQLRILHPNRNSVRYGCRCLAVSCRALPRLGQV